MIKSTSDIQVIHHRLLDEVSAQARSSPRLRKNYNFHAADMAPSHRLLNAVEPDSYIPPHCHADASKDETIVVLRGSLGVIFFDSHGAITQKILLTPGGDSMGVNIPHGVFHTLVALASGSVFFEAKAGPYTALTMQEKAAWAPLENDPQAPAYHAQLKKLFSETR